MKKDQHGSGYETMNQKPSATIFDLKPLLGNFFENKNFPSGMRVKGKTINHFSLVKHTGGRMNNRNLKVLDLEVVNESKAVRLINEIKPTSAFECDTKGFIGLLKGLNPLQFVSESIAQICHYRHQIKILETEQLRIGKEADIRHNQIDSALKLGLKILEERRLAIEISIEVVSKELEQSHLERSKIVESISNLTDQMSDKDYSSEDRQLFYSTIGLLAETLKEMGNQGTAKLTLITNNTRKVLETVPETRALLTFSN